MRSLDKENVFFKIFFVIVVILAIFEIGLTIHFVTMYGDKPISEVPSWVLFFLFWMK